MDNLIQLAVAALVTLPISLLFAVIGGRKLKNDQEVAGTWLLALSTEIAGALVVFLLLDTVSGAIGQSLQTLVEDSQQEIQEQIRTDTRISLESEMRSGSNETALIAVDELRTRDWLYDGTMQDWDLSRANLENAFFYRADLSRADFQFANLTGAHLGETDLTGVNFTGANLACAFLRDARLDGALFDERTILPNGEPWNPDRNMAWFTQPESYGEYSGTRLCPPDFDQDGIPNPRDTCPNEPGFTVDGCPG